MPRLRRFLGYPASFLALPLAVGGFGVYRYVQRQHPTRVVPANTELLHTAKRPRFDGAKRTVVVVLGADLTEITDALGP